MGREAAQAERDRRKRGPMRRAGRRRKKRYTSRKLSLCRRWSGHEYPRRLPHRNGSRLPLVLGGMTGDSRFDSCPAAFYFSSGQSAGRL